MFKIVNKKTNEVVFTAVEKGHAEIYINTSAEPYNLEIIEIDTRTLEEKSFDYADKTIEYVKEAGLSMNEALAMAFRDGYISNNDNKITL